jgi:formylglycine-generating enzyme required for sulfatase activity
MKLRLLVASLVLFTTLHARAAEVKGEPLTNSLGLKFVPVPDTKVLFCTTLTRKVDFAVYAAETRASDEQKKQWEVDKSEKMTLPVGGVSWEDAKAFCAWLSKKEHRTYRLPTDHEWSVAVGVGNIEDANAIPESLNQKLPNFYPWGNAWPPPKGAGNFADTSLKEFLLKKEKIAGTETIPNYTDGYWGTSPVTAFKPNRFGLHDMAGNLLQWCDDWYDAAKTKHPLRGSAWCHATKWILMSTFRGDPAVHAGAAGFRCVVEVPGS